MNLTYFHENECFLIFNYDILVLLRDYYIPFLIIIGVIGNLLSCVVFLSTSLKLRSSSYYLAALAIADLVYLISLFVVVFLNSFFNTDGWCELFVYVSQVSSSLSTWLIVAFTVERFIAVQYPLKRPQMCTVSRAKSVVFGLTTVAMFIHAYVFWTSGVLQRENGLECEIVPELYSIMTVLNYFDTVFSFIMPFVLIVVMNVMIARSIFKFSKRIASGNFQDSGGSGGRFGESISSTTKQSGSQCTSQKSATTKCPMSNPREQEQLSSIHFKSTNLMSTKIQHGISKMLLLVSSVFICFNLPSYVIRAYTFFVISVLNKEPPKIIWCIQHFCMIIFYTNYSINFMLYSMYGITFRRCLWQVIRNAITITQNAFN
ncbi:thyrotropin-releasing hormone receptor-like [Onthophagus taurus]|uniref:thyrotropin-releasing hormone receptor-like n=1 Tax=Onthophagus taurus TaxID=166361 RepID=UPI000C20AF73|nr:thyrotropin-releasing hormone receptor-like [Onthophagus taurus]